jgi:hypothetical protein
MPLSQNPIVEWPAEFHHLLRGIQIAIGSDGNHYGRIDIDVDRETLFLINDFEARVRHRQVRLRLTLVRNSDVGRVDVLTPGLR